MRTDGGLKWTKSVATKPRARIYKRFFQKEMGTNNPSH